MKKKYHFFGHLNLKRAKNGEYAIRMNHDELPNTYILRKKCTLSWKKKKVENPLPSSTTKG